MMLATEGRPGDAIACRETASPRHALPDQRAAANEAIVACRRLGGCGQTPTLVTRHSLREQRKGATVLLVDASRDSQILAAHILGRHDCSVVVAQDLKEAIAALEQDVYDVVLVDTALAGLDGKDTARTLRATWARTPNPRSWCHLARPWSGFQKAMKGIGFDATVAKPLQEGRPAGPAQPVNPRAPGRPCV